MSHPVTKSGDSVYVVKKEVLERYQIKDKLKDFSVSKKNGSSEPLSTIQNENNSKPKKANTPKTDKTKKISPEKHHSKTKKIDPLQRSLDCFRVQQPNIAITKCAVSSPVTVKSIKLNVEASPKDVKKYSKKADSESTSQTSTKKVSKKATNKEPWKSVKKAKDKPENELSKKNLKKSSNDSSQKDKKSDETGLVSPHKTTAAIVKLDRCPGISPVKVKQIGDKVTIESLGSSGQSDSDSYEITPKKSTTDKDESSNIKAKAKTNAFSLLKSSASSKSLKTLSEKKPKKEKKEKREKMGKEKVGEVTDSADERKEGKTPKEKKEQKEKKEKEENKEKEKKEKSEKKERKVDEERKTSKKTKKQETVDLTVSSSTEASPVVVLDDSQDKPDVEMVAVSTSPVKADQAMQSQGTSTSATNKKQKKQKTLSEMFNAALQRDKPRALSRVIHKAIEQNVSPLDVSLDINTPAKNKIKEKYEQIKWKFLSAEEKQKIKAEKQKVRDAMRNEKKRQEKLKRLEENKKIEDTDLELKPLPEGKPIVLPDELTIECFSEVLMVVEFIINYKDLLVPDEKLDLTTDSLIKALMSGEKGVPVLSRVLFILLNILHQNLRGKKKWMHILSSKLSDMPLTEHTAPELARAYLQKIMTINDSQLRDHESEMLSEILQDMEKQDFFLLKPQQKLKILVSLCHVLMSSDAIDNFIEARYEEYLENRRQKIKEEQEVRIKKKEKKEKERNEKEKAEQEKKLSSSLNNQESTNTSPKPAEEGNTNKQISILDVLVKDDKKDEEKSEDAKDNTSATNDEPSEIAKTIKNRRMQIELRKQEMEKKEKEERERRLKEEEESRREQVKQEHEDSIIKFKKSLRMVPLGYDRYHRRYWLFNGINGLYVEDGWISHTAWRPETPPPANEIEDIKDDGTKGEANSTTDAAVDVDGKANVITIEDETTSKDKDCTTMEVTTVVNGGNNEVITIEDNNSKDVEATENKDDSQDVIVVKEVENSSKQTISTDIPEDKSLRDVPYTWYYYDDVEDIKVLLEGLASRGIRESVLRQVIDGEKLNIEKNLKRKREEEDSVEDSQEDILVVNLQQSILDLADRITRGNLGEIDKIDKYIKDVEKAAKLAPYVIKLQKSIFPRFLQGILTEDNNMEKWVQCVEEATTISQFHLLLEILDTAVLWNKSAEGARCKICRKHGNEDDVLLLCDECNLGFHLYCLRPVLNKIPKGEWKCMSCQPVSTARSSRTNRVLDESNDSDESEDSDDSNESIENEDFCHTCQEGGDELICCDTCPLVFHKECHDPPLRYTPRGAWSCAECKRPKKVKTRQQSGKANTSKTSSKATRKPPKRRDSDESSNASSSKNRRSTRKRQLEDDDDEVESRKRRKISRKRQIDEESEESEENESDEEESDEEEEEEEGSEGSSDSDEEEEDSGSEEEEPVVIKRSSRNTRSQKQTQKANAKAPNRGEKRKAPPKPDTKPAAKPVPSKRRRTNPELEVCETILIEMLRSEDSWPFLEPVNLKEVPDYQDLVSEPMDFKTIKERLEYLEYSDAEPFVRDMRLVFENCDTYNHISTDEGQAGNRLSKEFETILKEHLPRLVKSKKRSTRRK